ncbi:MAG: hypothetical protein AAFQ38_14970 [Pseudomonadota bacterium]
MNKERILEAADKFAELPDENPENGLGFDMRSYLDVFQQGDLKHGCGAVCCITGWVQFWDGNRFDWTSRNLAEHWGISHEDAWRIAHPNPERCYKDARPRHAEALLRHFAETGEVDWPLAMETV